jgi:murein DD-endopeptidase MepM/ murein hydrolase activator NlpD
MSDSFDFGDIFKTLREFFDNITSRKEKREQRSNIVNDPTFRGFQAPMRGALKNSGGFDPSGTGSVGRVHQGLDLRNAGGSSIYSIAPGTVKQVYSDPKGGNAVVIAHPNGYSSYYAHLGSINVHSGDKVDYDTIIGSVGASGNAKGFPHLHMQVWHNGSLIDPASLFNVPPYTPFNAKTEKLWLPGAKEKANRWSMQEHLNSVSNQKRVV